MFGFGKERNAEFSDRYATRADYCRIFQEDIRPLYLVSFLLTANHARAEQGYVEGIENAFKGNPVFKEWARCWSKRSVIQQAIRLVFSESVQNEVRDDWHEPLRESRVRSVIDVVTRLAPLKRFVFVMSVLERYSDRECSVLLNCTVQDVIDARVQALRTLAGLDPVSTDAAEQQIHSSPVQHWSSREIPFTVRRDKPAWRGYPWYAAFCLRATQRSNAIQVFGPRLWR
jgi:DNA-directed RNA polymerase specialized sigma24 family protein